MCRIVSSICKILDLFEFLVFDISKGLYASFVTSHRWISSSFITKELAVSTHFKFPVESLDYTRLPAGRSVIVGNDTCVTVMVCVCRVPVPLHGVCTVYLCLCRSVYVIPVPL